MKLIIDINDEMYDFTINARKARTYTAEHYVDLILNGEPLQEELEKIKAEMKEERDSVDLSCADTFNWNIRLVDKHIAELKGEE